MHTSLLPLSLFIGRLAIYVCIVLLTFQLALPFLAPLILACIVASIFLELQKHLPSWLVRRKGLYAGLTTLATLFLIIVPIFVILILLGMEAFSFIEFLRDLLGSTGYAAFQEQLYLYELDVNNALAPMGVEVNSAQLIDSVTGNLELAGTFLYNNAAHLLANIANLLFSTFIFLFVTFFLIKDGDRLITGIKGILPFEKQEAQLLVDAVEHVGQTVILGSMVASLCLGGIMAIVFALFGFNSPILWGMCIALLSLVPLVGTWLIYIPSIVFLVLTTSWVKALFFFLVIVAIENVLYYGVIRPRFLDVKTQLYPIAIFIAILGGLSSFGPMGIVYGPLIMATFITLMKHIYLVRKELI